MNKKIKFLLILIFFILIISLFFKIFEKKTVQSKKSNDDEILYDLNKIKNVHYVSRDAKGNEYIIKAYEGQIDIKEPNIIYLTGVNSIINLNNSNKIAITSNFGKYNLTNFDTIFSKNVIIKYLENKITGEYLDFSINNNLMILSRDVVYTSPQNILKADVVEINIDTKDTKIYMYENNKKVNIKNKN